MKKNKKYNLNKVYPGFRLYFRKDSKNQKIRGLEVIPEVYFFEKKKKGKYQDLNLALLKVQTDGIENFENRLYKDSSSSSFTFAFPFCDPCSKCMPQRKASKDEIYKRFTDMEGTTYESFMYSYEKNLKGLLQYCNDFSKRSDCSMNEEYIEKICENIKKELRALEDRHFHDRKYYSIPFSKKR